MTDDVAPAPPEAQSKHESVPLTVAELATQWATSDQVIRGLLRHGELRGVKIGRGWRIFPADIQTYLRARTNQQGPS